jgi:hypothetical protein
MQLFYSFYSFIFFFFPETGFHYVAQAGLKLFLVHFLSAGITGMYHHTQQGLQFLKKVKEIKIQGKLLQYNKNGLRKEM